MTVESYVSIANLFLDRINDLEIEYGNFRCQDGNLSSNANNIGYKVIA